MTGLMVRDSSGMVLIEVLTGAVLITLISLVFYAMFWSSLNAMQSSRSETQASSTACAILESLRDDREQIPWGSPGQLFIPADLDPGVEIPQGMRASLEIIPEEEGLRLSLLKVRLEWYGKKEPRSLEMVTLVRKNTD